MRKIAIILMIASLLHAGNNDLCLNDLKQVDKYLKAMVVAKNNGRDVDYYVGMFKKYLDDLLEDCDGILDDEKMQRFKNMKERWKAYKSSN